MSTIPPLNYFMEKETARTAVKNFSLTLQEAFKEYKKIWNMYLDLAKKCEDDASRSLSSSITKVVGQKNGNYKCTGSTYINEQDMTNSVHSMEDTLLQFPIDLHSSMEESNEENSIEKTKQDVMPKSPIFNRNNYNSRNRSLKEINSVRSPSKSMTSDNNFNSKEQENVDHSHSSISTSSTTNIHSPVLLCSTPIKNKKWSKSKKQTVKKSKRSKLVMPSNSPKKKNNLFNIKKNKTNKVPLKIINNVNLIPKNNISQADKINSNKSYNMQVTTSPRSRKFKQTKLIFNKTNETMELSNDFRSSNISQTTITNKSVSSQEKNLKQGTLTNSMSLKEKRTNDEQNGNNYKQVEIKENRTTNNFDHICTHTGIKDELILPQENEQINLTEESNISIEPDMTFFLDNENDTNLNKSNDASSDSNKTYISMVKSKNETNAKKRCI